MSPLARCCQHAMREIAICAPEPMGLVALICDGCRRVDWRRQGRPVTADEALEIAKAFDRSHGAEQEAGLTV